jgi:hypothetical protein
MLPESFLCHSLRVSARDEPPTYFPLTVTDLALLVGYCLIREKHIGLD